MREAGFALSTEGVDIMADVDLQLVFGYGGERREQDRLDASKIETSRLGKRYVVVVTYSFGCALMATQRWGV